MPSDDILDTEVSSVFFLEIELHKKPAPFSRRWFAKNESCSRSLMREGRPLFG